MCYARFPLASRPTAIPTRFFQFSDRFSLHVHLRRVKLFTRDFRGLDVVSVLANSLLSNRAGKKKQQVVYLIVEIQSVEKRMKIILHYYINNLNSPAHLWLNF